MAAESDMEASSAPGWPGIPARWTSSAKSGVGTALGGSAVWFTLSHGILTEGYAPRMDEAATRDLGFLVTSADGCFSDETRDARHGAVCPPAGAPSYRVARRCSRGRYSIETEVISDPGRPV